MNITEPLFGEDEVDQVRAVLSSKWVTQGPKTKEFEELFATRHEVKYALATTSCTAALHLATMALDLGPGDEVVVPAFTWVTSASCAEYVGADVRFVDVDPLTFNIDGAALRSVVTDRTKAIVAVHLFGKAAPMDEINEIVAGRGIRVIEDAACAVGTRYEGRLVGSLGDLGCFSFHPRKVITTGEGGMVTTNNAELAERVKSLRNHGATGPAPGVNPAAAYAMGTFDNLGYNLRLSDIQAAVGVAQMSRLDGLLDERRRLALSYRQMLSDQTRFVLPQDDAGHTYQSFVLRVADGSRETRNQIMDRLSGLGIQTRPGTHAVHRLGYYREKYGLRAEDFPEAARAEDTTITLPIFPGMSEGEQSRVVASLLT
jgi:perosamine synthetase